MERNPEQFGWPSDDLGWDEGGCDQCGASADEPCYDDCVYRVRYDENDDDTELPW